MRPEPKLTRIAGQCDGGDCPTVYRTERGTIAVQGERLHAVRCADGEAVVLRQKYEPTAPSSAGRS